MCGVSGVVVVVGGGGDGIDNYGGVVVVVVVAGAGDLNIVVGFDYFDFDSN